jgi:hypothetical protein
MKRAFWLAPVILAFLVFSGCLTGGAEKEPWLAGLDNPFLGKWQSDIPSAGTTLTFDYKDDGTFDYEMAGVPAGQGGKGRGGYAVYGDIQLSYLDFEGAALYRFKVVDNNTINVTELEPDGAGGFRQGNTAPFTRVPGSPVNRRNRPLKLDNPFLGKWRSDIPSAGTTLTFDYKDDGTFGYEMAGVPAGQGGRGRGCYIVYGDKQVSYLDFEGAALYRFKAVDSDTIDVTELEPDGAGGFKSGNTAPFTRVRD